VISGKLHPQFQVTFHMNWRLRSRHTTTNPVSPPGLSMGTSARKRGSSADRIMSDLRDTRDDVRAFA
jgi:hypothetical protein